MTNPLLLLAFSTFASQTHLASTARSDRAAWPVGLSASAKTVPLSRGKARLPLKPPSDPKTLPYVIKPPVARAATPAPRRYGLVLSDPYPEMAPPAPGTLGSSAWIATLRTLQGGLRDQAHALAVVDEAERFFDAYPDERAGIGYLLSDLYVALGWWTDAYRLMAPLATKDADEPTLLRASVAAAARGEVYPGQRAFCVRSIAWGWSRFEDRRENLPQGDSPADVLTVSLLATMLKAEGQKDAVRLYGGLVLQRDPGNPIVCDVLARYALAEGRTTEAIALLNKGLSRARGPMVDSIRSDLHHDRRLLAQEQVAKAKSP